MTGPVFIDSFYDGPHEVLVNGRRTLFEFSEQFGPVVLCKDGWTPKQRQPAREDHPFWVPFEAWLKGRKADG